MEHMKLYLLQYARGKEVLNRFYCGKNCLEEIGVLVDRMKRSKTYEGEPLEKIADAVEKNHAQGWPGLARVRGMKANLKSYDGIISPNNITRYEVS